MDPSLLGILITMKQRRHLLPIFIAVAAAVILSTATTFLAGRAAIKGRNVLFYHLKITDQIGDLFSTLKDAETGQRGYVITGDDAYLAPYSSAINLIPSQVQALRNTGALPLPLMNSLDAAIQQKLAELAATVQMVRSSDSAGARRRVEAGEGMRYMDTIRRDMTQAKSLETDALQAADRMANRATAIRSITFFFTGIVDLIFILWAYRRISREISEVQRQRDLLSVTLESIGDCVIITDIEGRITFMNAVAEHVTGWSFQETEQQPVSRIFRIVNENSRMPVENPVEKVLRTGAIVGLANHTLLIRKDGAELPIDDSGAPIREPGGEVRGVVLVFRDFSDHKNAQKQLVEAKTAAEAANSAKDQFLAMLSHELRTPLAPVLATLNRWESAGNLPDGISSEVQMLRRSVELEARIIDDLLDLTRIAKGMLTLSPEICDVHELLGYLTSMYESDFQGKRILFSMNLDAADHFVDLDSSRLQQVLWNVLRNAVKFTERGDSITVSTSNETAGNIVITVTDTGIGMTEETMSRLFLPFEQGEKVISRRYGGLGLGMAISKALVDLLGGSISAASEGLGKGSSFTIRLPALRNHSAQASRPPTPVPRHEDLRLDILLVEDHVDTAASMSRLLAARGHKVRVAESVKAARAAMDDASFDLLLCDLGLPDGSGEEVISYIRKSSGIPAIALSGFGMDEDIARCKQAGFNSHLTKPVNFRQLEHAMWRLTRDSASLPQRASP